jgi:hypothetical protein
MDHYGSLEKGEKAKMTFPWVPKVIWNLCPSHAEKNVLISFVLTDHKYMLPIDQAKNSSSIRFYRKIL